MKALPALILSLGLVGLSCGVSSAKAGDDPHAGWPILTPRPGPEPRINGPLIYGCRPGHPFLYRIPATGDRAAMRFAADGLPAGLALNSASGVISGSIGQSGRFRVTLRASNSHGAVARPFEIACGDTLALTPPMGWNDWYAFYDTITDQLVREAADLMVANGMADAGYQYVNIDDCWMNAPKYADPRRVGPLRDARGDILPNSYFPDMAALTAYIHAQGLKAGIYSSPGPLTCGSFGGSYGHEAQDAARFARWGFDFLKYDWCSYGGLPEGRQKSLAALERPYALMGQLVRRQDRDMVFNLCQYGMGDVWEWGTKVGGQCWRTDKDLGPKLDQFFVVALANIRHGDWSGPGSWNDPDYIQIGYLGPAEWRGPEGQSKLTADEQYAFMSLWCLMSSPLFYSGNLAKMDAFTLNVLCNPEVIAIDQDPLGKCARVVARSGSGVVLVKDLADGGKAIGLGNQGDHPLRVGVNWTELNLGASQRVRDPWRQRDAGLFETGFSSEVPAHGLVLLRLEPAAPNPG